MKISRWKLGYKRQSSLNHPTLRFYIQATVESGTTESPETLYTKSRITKAIKRVMYNVLTSNCMPPIYSAKHALQTLSRITTS